MSYSSGHPTAHTHGWSPHAARSERSVRNGLAGRSAEDAVARRYQLKGHELLAQRWRGGGGELDLVFADGDGLIFVEVKKSSTHARARARVSSRQMRRIVSAGYAYLATRTAGLLTEVRIDVATVDQFGQIDVSENAIQEM